MAKRKIVFQSIKFSSLEECFESIPEHELKIVEVLRKIIFNCISDVEEKLSYNAPFYKRKGNICFIWPGSIPWGKPKEGVQLGFSKGYLLSDDGYLEKGNRKQVFWKTFYSVKEIDIDKVSALLYEAVLLDR
ncbi:MAG: DUF1801 domain-containing protein [Sphingobacteriales bacterium]|nr:MAG: DUF1801 domain-containing protein [Sphingobacteriales bacterium]